MSTEPLDPQTAYYYNTKTGEVEQGLVSDWSDRMGPYPTREAAASALSTAAQRNRDWDAEERAWRGEDD